MMRKFFWPLLAIPLSVGCGGGNGDGNTDSAKAVDFASGSIQVASYDDPGTPTDPWELSVDTLYGTAWASTNYGWVTNSVIISRWEHECDGWGNWPAEGARIELVHNAENNGDGFTVVDVNFHDQTGADTGVSLSDEYSLEGLSLDDVQHLSAGDVAEGSILIELAEVELDFYADVEFRITHCGDID
jgi:hypothetical protein